MQSHSEILGVRTSIYELVEGQGRTIQPIPPVYTIIKSIRPFFPGLCIVLPTQASKEPQVLPQRINAVPIVLVLIFGIIYNIKF